MSEHKKSRGTLLFSSKQATTCRDCGETPQKCKCSRVSISPTGDGIVRIHKETKGRKGKGVSVITGLALIPQDLEKLCKTLKKKLGIGGTVKGDTIEIQGDQRERLKEELGKLGHESKVV